MTDIPACTVHTDVPAIVNCHGCRRPFCDNCVVEFDGGTWCGPCKNRAVAGSLASTDYRKPREALIMAFVGIFICCFGIIIEPIALVRSMQALNEIKANPSLPGRSTALTAAIMSAITLLVYIGIIGYIAIKSSMR